MNLATFLWAVLVMALSFASASNLENENIIEHHLVPSVDIRTERTVIDPEVQEKVLDVVEGLCSERQNEAYEAFVQLANLKYECISAIYKLMYLEDEETAEDEEEVKILPAVTVLRECKFPRILELFREFMNNFQKSKLESFAIEHKIFDPQGMIPDFGKDDLELLHRKILLEFQKRLHDFIFTNPRKTNWSETYLNGISVYSSMSEVLEGSLAKHISDKMFHGTFHEEESREVLWLLWSSVNEKFGAVSEQIVETAMRTPYPQCVAECDFLFSFGDWDNEFKAEVSSPSTEEYLSCCNSGEFAPIKEEEEEDEVKEDEEEDYSDMPAVEVIIEDVEGVSGVNGLQVTESHESNESSDEGESNEGSNDSNDSNVSNESNISNADDDLSYHSLVGTCKYLLIKDVEELAREEEQQLRITDADSHDHVPAVDVVIVYSDDEDVDEIIIEAVEVEREVNEPHLNYEEVVADEAEEVDDDEEEDDDDQVTDVDDIIADQVTDVAGIADDQVADIDDDIAVGQAVVVDESVVHSDAVEDEVAIESHHDDTVDDDNTAHDNTVEPELEPEINITESVVDSVDREVDVDSVIPSSATVAAAVISESRRESNVSKCARRKPKSVKIRGIKKVKIIKWGKKGQKKKSGVSDSSSDDSTSASSSDSESGSDSDSESSNNTTSNSSTVTSDSTVTNETSDSTNSSSTTSSDSTTSTTSSNSTSTTSNSFFSSDKTFEALENRQRTLKRPLRLVYPDGRVKLVNVTDSNKTDDNGEDANKDENTADASIKMASKTTTVDTLTANTTAISTDSTADTIFYINNVMLVALVLGMSWMIYLKWHLITAD